MWSEWTPPHPQIFWSRINSVSNPELVKRRTKADSLPQNLKILVESILIPEEVLAHPGDWNKIGEEHHDELDVIKSEIFWRRTIRKKFVHKTDKTRPPVIAPAPLPSIPGTLLASALAARIITDKYQDHLPHYRHLIGIP